MRVKMPVEGLQEACRQRSRRCISRDAHEGLFLARVQIRVRISTIRSASLGVNTGYFADTVIY